MLVTRRAGRARGAGGITKGAGGAGGARGATRRAAAVAQKQQLAILRQQDRGEAEARAAAVAQAC
jgi:hypothetical protein